MTRAQLLALGVSARTIERRAAAGRLRRIHRGVYALGPLMLPGAEDHAAVLACGQDAALSHDSCAVLVAIRPGPPPSPPHVTVPGRNLGPIPGIHVHRTRSLPASEVTTHEGIRITTPARTLLDLSPTLAPSELEQAVAEAFALRLVTRPALLRVLEAHPRRPGAPALRALLDAERPPARTRSAPERRLLTLIRRARLPEPEVNARLGRWEVDMLWREQRLAVEIDAYSTHSSPRAFERDRRKQADLQAAGLRVERLSARRVRLAPEAVLDQIAAALGIGPPTQ